MNGRIIASGWQEIDEITDATGDAITVTVIGHIVSLTTESADDDEQAISVHLDSARREKFEKAYAEAKRRADAWEEKK